MLKTLFDETVDLFADAGASRRVLHPEMRELVDVQTPDFAVSAPLRHYEVDFIAVSSSPGCEFAEGFFKNVALFQSIAYVTQRQVLQRRDVVLQWKSVRCWMP